MCCSITPTSFKQQFSSADKTFSVISCSQNALFLPLLSLCPFLNWPLAAKISSPHLDYTHKCLQQSNDILPLASCIPTVEAGWYIKILILFSLTFTVEFQQSRKPSPFQALLIAKQPEKWGRKVFNPCKELAKPTDFLQENTRVFINESKICKKLPTFLLKISHQQYIASGERALVVFCLKPLLLQDTNSVERDAST